MSHTAIAGRFGDWEPTSSGGAGWRKRLQVLASVVNAWLSTDIDTASGVAQSDLVFADPDTTDGWASTAIEESAPSNYVSDLKEQSGLTWNEFARLFGVTRRSVHNWATGGRMNARHAARLGAVGEALAQFSGPPDDMRMWLLTPGRDGVTPYRRLVNEVARPLLPPSVHPLDLLGNPGVTEPSDPATEDSVQHSHSE